MDNLYIVMPAYNEEENIREVVQSWYPLLEGKSEDSRLVIADSGSKDRTHQILLELQETCPQLEILEDSDRQHGPKVLALYRYAVEHQADHIFQTDSDGQTDPAEFASFCEARKTYDVILGKRRVRGDGRARAFVERVVCILLRLYFGVKVPDANAPFRLMKTDIVAKYLDYFPADYHLPNIIFTMYFVRYQENVSFQEISFKPRQGGKNSINIPKIIKTGCRALGDFRKFRERIKG